jgi:hypothetical protein
MGFKRNVDKKSGPIMMQNSPLPKCESRNPRQTICEFRKIHRAGDYIPWMAANRLAGDFGPHPRPRQPQHQLSLQRIESNTLAQPKTTFKPN